MKRAAWVVAVLVTAGTASASDQALVEAQAREISRLRAELAALDDSADFAIAEALGIAGESGASGLLPRQRRRVAVAIVREARRNRLDPLLVAAVIHAESAFDCYALSPAGAMGLMQVMPATGRFLSARRGQPLGPARNLFDAELNIELGTAYLADLLARFGSVEAALVAYNAGPGAARRILADRRARQRFLAGYPRTVTAELARLRALPRPAPPDDQG